ncbi:methyltransferase domain-containing protein [Periweissella beninensis]|uniref:methyltransferase domain-containing protein n=1 Tax=Periweissella beninensis TaxID=504936 RepID=UPI0021A2E70D|nr:methyltransferase domain-containing protein [Periweissella beninensis]MCT4395665.1 methyltransferase domain-containing protein [Periweissella beninensis]
MKKIDKSRVFLEKNSKLFRCNICQSQTLTMIGNTLNCENGHSLDLSKKGTLYFIKHAVNTEYDDQMLSARRRVLQAGLFDGIIDAVGHQIPDEAQTILDVGTGEGTPLVKLVANRQQQDVAVGFDISKAGINLATQLAGDAFFAVADLAELPFADKSFSSIIEFFSPSAYEEFNRVLKPNGVLIKVVPASEYLKELREILYPVDSPKRTYSNEKVVDLFMEHYPNAKRVPVKYEWKIPQENYQDLLHMTPLHWGARPEAQAAAAEQPLQTITVAVELLIVHG